jgi:hypothetical protein
VIGKEITYCGHRVVIGCDARCDKAWGMNARPRVEFHPNDDPDDFAWLCDDELGNAPMDPGTYEGGQAKPVTPEDRLNKWCARECERSHIADTWLDLRLLDFSVRVYNMPWMHNSKPGHSREGRRTW